jgi:hypothetical protein
MIKYCSSCGFANSYDLVSPKTCSKCAKNFDMAFIVNLPDIKDTPAPVRKFVSTRQRREEIEEEYEEEKSYDIAKLDVEVESSRQSAKFGNVIQEQKTGIGRRDKPKVKKQSDKAFFQEIQAEMKRNSRQSPIIED